MTNGRCTVQTRRNMISVSNADTPRASGLQPSDMATQTEGPASTLEEAANLDTLMQAILACQMALTSKIHLVQADIDLIRCDVDQIREQVMEVERRVSDVEDVQCDHHADLQTLKIEVKHLESKAEDAENCNCHNNLQIIGLPEGTEGADPVAFTERLLHTLLPRIPSSPHSSPLSGLTACQRLEALQEPRNARLFSSSYTIGTAMLSSEKRVIRESYNMRMRCC